jgi:hypothetical protein
VSDFLKYIIENAKRQPSPKEDEAARRYVQERSPIKEYLDVIHEEKKKRL